MSYNTRISAEAWGKATCRPRHIQERSFGGDTAGVKLWGRKEAPVRVVEGRGSLLSSLLATANRGKACGFRAGCVCCKVWFHNSPAGLDKSLSFWEPQFPYLLTEISAVRFRRIVWKISCPENIICPLQLVNNLHIFTWWFQVFMAHRGKFKIVLKLCCVDLCSHRLHRIIFYKEHCILGFYSK